ncbi:hypothetical protein HBB16_19375 [Pseudonocardia sp. MCCB 268]|nr:hypothetical protein [Pseudonocardia cytotoxica]
MHNPSSASSTPPDPAGRRAARGGRTDANHGHPCSPQLHPPPGLTAQRAADRLAAVRRGAGHRRGARSRAVTAPVIRLAERACGSTLPRGITVAGRAAGIGAWPLPLLRLCRVHDADVPVLPAHPRAELLTPADLPVPAGLHSTSAADPLAQTSNTPPDAMLV